MGIAMGLLSWISGCAIILIIDTIPIETKIIIWSILFAGGAICCSIAGIKR